MIRVFQPSLGREELEAVSEVFHAQWPGAGPRVGEFEAAFAQYAGVAADQMTAVTSCTEGLFQAVAALELAPDDEVILPTVSFIGAAHAVRSAGARIRLTDVDRFTLNPTAEHVEAALNRRTKAAVLLHFGGRLDDIQRIADLLKRKSVILIEDSACSLGGRCNAKPYGTYGDVAVWSFDAMKLLVAGDGGMVRTRDPFLRKKISDGVKLGGAMSGLERAEDSSRRWWEVNPAGFGRKSFMNDLTAAIGLAQLSRIDSFVVRRREISRRYDSAFSPLPWIRLPPAATDESVPYFYWIQTATDSRDKLAYYLKENGVYTTFRYWPLHRTQLYRCKTAAFPGAEVASDTTLLLPVHQSLSDLDVERIIELVRRFPDAQEHEANTKPRI